MMSWEENAIILLSPPLSDSLRFVITSRESSLSLFLSVASSCTSKVEWSFLYSWVFMRSICFSVCERGQGILYLLFIWNSYFWKTFFFPWPFFFLSLHARALEMQKNWVKALATVISLWIQSSILSQSCVFHVSLSLCYISFLIVQRAAWFLFQPWGRMLQ